MLKILGAAVAAIAFAASANAVVNVSSTTSPYALAAGQTVLFDFDSGTPAGLTGNFDIVTGSSSGVYAAPLGDTTHYLTVPKDLSVTPVTATLDLGGGYKKLSLYWGSIDTYNTIEFFNGTTSLGSVSGGTLPPATGDTTSSSTNRNVSFDFGGAKATSVVFTSTQYAFELDNIAGAVPEPTTWAMLIAGMGLVGASMRRRRVITSVTA